MLAPTLDVVIVGIVNSRPQGDASGEPLGVRCAGSGDPGISQGFGVCAAQHQILRLGSRDLDLPSKGGDPVSYLSMYSAGEVMPS